MLKSHNDYRFIIRCVYCFCLFLTLIGCRPLYRQRAVPKEQDDCELASHFAYTLSYNSKTLTANWVAYELTAKETNGPWSRKGLRFMPDLDCKSKQADNEDYRNSGYTRGHLAPAGDMKWDSLAMSDEFTLFVGHCS